MTSYEERVWRSYLVGWHHHASARPCIGLDQLLVAVESNEGFDRAIESREQVLERQLEDERKALRALRRERVEWSAV